MDKYKKAAIHNWGSAPCGSDTVNISEKEYLSKEYFDALDEAQFLLEPWRKEEFSAMDIAGKKVLEIGYGMGRDHLELAKWGGELYGIDLTPGNLSICQKHLEINGYSSKLIVGDAFNMPYEDNFFDFVYSFGVIHHIPNMENVVKEIYRVLKPGGRCWVAVYNRDSWFYKYHLLPGYYISGDYKKMTIPERLSLIEYPHTNKDILVRLTTKQELKNIFAKFEVSSIINRSLTEETLIYAGVNIGKFIPQRILSYMEKKWGWYNIVKASKI